MNYRLALDVGTNSLGWWIWEQDDAGDVIRAVDGGVRIFSDGLSKKTKTLPPAQRRKRRGARPRPKKMKTSLAVQRRERRGARRRLDRYQKRRKKLFDKLIACGLMPQDKVEQKKLEKSDPYTLRVQALDRPLAPHKLGRALFHLNQRRGFQSNRKSLGDEEQQDGGGTLKEGIDTLDAEMKQAGARTLGEYLYWRRRDGKGTRARKGAGFYADRRHYRHEFNEIRKVQEPKLKLGDEKWDKLAKIIFYQRPLRPVKPGRCTFFPDEERAPKALPLSQQFRILQELANLEIRGSGDAGRRLDCQERERVCKLLLAQEKVTFKCMRSVLELTGEQYFNLESERRKHLQGDETAVVLAHKNCFGPRWRKDKSLDFDTRTSIVKYLLGNEDEEETEDQESPSEEKQVFEQIMREWGLDGEQIGHVRKVARARLPEGYRMLSEKAMGLIVDKLKEGMDYAHAVREVEPEEHGRELQDELLPYPEVLERYVIGGDDRAEDIFDRRGRINNSTVHIGLNQVRRLVNAIIREYGRPNKITVELAGDLKNSLDKRQEIAARYAKNQKDKEVIVKEIKACGEDATEGLIRRVRLWKEQGTPDDRHCPYCGRIICFRMVLRGEVDVDHILPFSLTLDDSMANKVVCCRNCNRDKGNQAPAEMFDPGSESYSKMIAHARHLPKNKRWRFDSDAMERFGKESNFLDRQLNDTRYFSKRAREYLQTICREVDVTTGALTGLLRGKWGLNNVLYDPSQGANQRKNRDDHRHHAVDAAVIGLTDKGMLQRVATAAARGTTGNRLIEDMPKPAKCPDFRRQIEQRVATIIAWHRPDHTVPRPDSDNHYTVVARKSIKALNEKALERVADTHLKEKLLCLWKNVEQSGGKWSAFAEKAAMPNVVTRDGVRHVQVRERMTGTSGALHNETAYGVVSGPDSDNGYIVVTRKPIKTLNEKALERVADTRLKDKLLCLWKNVEQSGGKWSAFAEKVATPNVVTRDGVRHVRVQEPMTGVVLISDDRAGRPYKAYKPDSNAFMEIFQMPDDKSGKIKWEAETVRTFDANQPGFKADWRTKYPNAKFVMRLHKNDLIAVGVGNARRILRVEQLSGQKIICADANEGGELDKRHKDPRDPFKKYQKDANPMREAGLRRVGVDDLGRIRDPGPCLSE